MAQNAPDPFAIIRSKDYIRLLVIALVFGVPVSLFAYLFLYVVNQMQVFVYATVPSHFASQDLRLWWPLVPLVLAGLIVGFVIKFLPGKGGEVPIEGLKTGGGPVQPSALTGITLAAVASIGLGAVIGPEAPLIALGGGLAYWWIKLVKKNIEAQAAAIVSASGSFAAVSTLLGSPLTGSFLMMEVTGLGGMMLDLVLLPGLLAAGVGNLIFIGLDSLTGLGTFALSVPNIPSFGAPTGIEFAWAIVIGLIAPVFAWLIHRLAELFRPRLERHVVAGTAIGGLVIGLLAVLFTHLTKESGAYILFSGQNQLGQLVASGADLSVGTLLLILLLKGAGYSVSLIAFRGGPTFPALFLGAAGGIALSHFAGLPFIAGVAMGLGAMSASVLKLPLTSVLLATLIFAADGITLMPLVIVAVVVAYVVTIRLTQKPQAA